MRLQKPLSWLLIRLSLRRLVDINFFGFCIAAPVGTVFELADVFCFTYFLSGFLFRVRGRVRVEIGVGGGFRVRVKAR